MSKDYKVESIGGGCYILVMNHERLNEVTNYHFFDKKYIKKQEYAIGYWKPKNK